MTVGDVTAKAKSVTPIFDQIQISFSSSSDQICGKSVMIVPHDYLLCETDKYNAEEYIYKKMGFSDPEEYTGAYPGKFSEDSGQFMRWNPDNLPCRNPDVDGNFHLNVKKQNIGTYNEEWQDDYKKFIDDVISGKKLIFYAPTVSQVCSIYEVEDDVSTYLRYCDFWFCSDWEED